MAKCYYSYSFDLQDGLILSEHKRRNALSPMRAVGYTAPLDFDDYVDIWKAQCNPIFEKPEDAGRLTRKYFLEAYKRGEKKILIELEHNPLQNTYAAKYTRINIHLYEDETTKRPHAKVMWEENPDLEARKSAASGQAK